MSGVMVSNCVFRVATQLKYPNLGILCWSSKASQERSRLTGPFSCSLVFICWVLRGAYPAWYSLHPCLLNEDSIEKFFCFTASRITVIVEELEGWGIGSSKWDMIPMLHLYSICSMELECEWTPSFSSDLAQAKLGLYLRTLYFPSSVPEAALHLQPHSLGKLPV